MNKQVELDSSRRAQRKNLLKRLRHHKIDNLMLKVRKLVNLLLPLLPTRLSIHIILIFDFFISQLMLFLLEKLVVSA